MGKIDKSNLKESKTPNSRSGKKMEIMSAQKALEFIKKNFKFLGNTFLDPGDCCYMRKVKRIERKQESLEGLYSIPEASDYLDIKPGTFAARTRSFNIPFTKIGKMKYFTQEVLDHHKATTIFRPRQNQNY